MSIFTGIMLYVILWWLAFFAMLPVGVKTAEEAGEDLGDGHAPSAPVKPALWRKALWAGLIAAVIFGIYYLIQASGLITLRPEF